MKRKFVQIAALCLSAALFLVSAGEKASAAPLPSASNGQIIRVGLHYGTGAMEGLNLLNDVGSGYRFGYYNSASQFVELGSTAQKAVSVVPTVNVYYGALNGYASYHTALTSSAVAVGVYHLQLPGTYASFAEAQAAASQYPGGFPAYIDGTFRARIGCYTTSDQAYAAQASLGAETTLSWTSKYGVNAVATGTNTILFQYDDNGTSTGLGVEPISVNGEKCATWSKDRLYNGGFRFERINGGMLTVVNILGLEDYLKGVVPNEMSDSWPLEALKAQAVAARSYVLSLGSKHSAHHFDICATTDCQAYYGRAKAGANSDGAVDQTVGQVAISNGKIAQTFYYSSNGGASESVSNVWGSNQASYPYLVGKADPYEPTLNLKNTWERTFTSSQIVSKLLSAYSVSGSIVSASVSSYTDVGNPRTITFTDSAGKNFSISGARVYQSLGLPSFRFGFKGTGGTSQPAPAPTAPSGSVTINGSAAVDSAAGLYAIDGNGNITAIGGDVYVITNSGVSQLGQGGQDQNQGQGQVSATNSWVASASAVNGSITFAGRGWGHNIGLSQYGAYAMANQGYTYQQILQFYYTGITVGYM